MWELSIDKIPRDLENMFDRYNWDVGEFRARKKNKTEKILDKEMEEEIRTQFSINNQEDEI